MTMNDNLFNLENKESKRISQKCDQLHNTCKSCQNLKNKNVCKQPKYFNNDFDLKNIIVYCSKYKKKK